MSKDTATYVRFSLTQRIEHLVMLLSFTTLALTGLPQKYPLASLSVSIIELLGGIENTRAIHHIAATVLMFSTIFHILSVGYKVFVLRVPMTMLPSLQDVRDAWQTFLYNLGLRPSRPQMGRYTFEEKFEYWALVWGIIIMGLTGFLMWNPITSAKILPGEFIPAAKAAHGAEALLAVLSVLIWHTYGVHFRHFNKAMWTGRLSEEEMLEEHPLELADLKAGTASRRPDADTLRKRQLIYFPIATILAAIFLAAVYGFVSYEETAITTVAPPPMEEVAVFVPQTPTPLPLPTATPTATPAPVAALTWESYVGPLLQSRCGTCHGATAMGGLSYLTYEDAMKGSENGPVILPEDAINSRIVIVMNAGGHYGQLSLEELSRLEEWINAGAPER